MPKVRVVKIVFDTSLRDHEIPKFRGAVIDMVGRDHVVFHNHLGNNHYHYAYPVVQYKTQGQKAGIVCIQEGVEEIHHFFSKNEGSLRIGHQRRSLLVESVKLNRFEVDVSEQEYAYAVRKWLPLNEANYQKFQLLESPGEKLNMLERMLVGNLLSFAKGIRWTVDKPIRVSISSLPSQGWVKHKGVRMLAFDLDFRANVSLPSDIGLGKGASIGFGTITQKRR